MKRFCVSVTKQNGWCKVSTRELILCFALSMVVGPTCSADTVELRDCIAAAGTPVAMAACERQQQTALKGRIRELTAGIRARLDRGQRLVFDRSQETWLAFIDHETAMLDLSLGIRNDGLGPSLRPGAITRLYEQREQQLREHLHSLSFGRPPPGGAAH